MVHALLGNVSGTLFRASIFQVNYLNLTFWTEFGITLILYHHNQFLWDLRHP